MSEGEGAPKIDADRLDAVSAVADAAERWVDGPSMRAMVEGVESSKRAEIRLALKASYMRGFALGMRVCEIAAGIAERRASL